MPSQIESGEQCLSAFHCKSGVNHSLISQPWRAAISSARPVLPDAVGPSTAITGILSALRVADSLSDLHCIIKSLKFSTSSAVKVRAQAGFYSHSSQRLVPVT